MVEHFLQWGLGAVAPEQPLVPTGVKSPSRVSGRREALKTANRWRLFLCARLSPGPGTVSFSATSAALAGACFLTAAKYAE